MKASREEKNFQAANDMSLIDTYGLRGLDDAWEKTFQWDEHALKSLDVSIPEKTVADIYSCKKEGFAVWCLVMSVFSDEEYDEVGVIYDLNRFFSRKSYNFSSPLEEPMKMEQAREIFSYRVEDKCNTLNKMLCDGQNFRYLKGVVQDIMEKAILQGKLFNHEHAGHMSKAIKDFACDPFGHISQKALFHYQFNKTGKTPMRFFGSSLFLIEALSSKGAVVLDEKISSLVLRNKQNYQVSTSDMTNIRYQFLKKFHNKKNPEKLIFLSFCPYQIMNISVDAELLSA